MVPQLIQLTINNSLTTVKDYSALINGIVIGFIVFLIKFIKDSEFSTINIILLIALGVSYLYIGECIVIARTASRRTTFEEHQKVLKSQRFYLYIALITFIFITVMKLIFGIYLLITGVYSFSFSLLIIYFLLFSYCSTMIFQTYSCLHDNKNITEILLSESD